ncbi:MAG: YifB family Mg chelatase-like AAA ATPase [Candidatus Pacebacteria bacterium]|nr:YifB family Mg chelatase-like AAA ATPase [Candidatus Paceibacterota bacterium]
MKFSRVFSAQPEYLEGAVITVEVDISRGLHSFVIVGMASKAVDEARDRVSSALKNSHFSSPKSKNEKLVVSLVPADLKKEGSYHDVAIALAYLLASEELSFEKEKKVFIGELSLDGTVRPVLGILPIVQAAKKAGFEEIFVPFENREEAALVDGICIYPVETLTELVLHLDEKHELHKKITPQSSSLPLLEKVPLVSTTDFVDIRGQLLAKRGLEIAAAGGHNICMFGPPGTGKTMLARAFCSILPPLKKEHLLEVITIHSVTGGMKPLEYMTEVPLRTPHHTASYVALIGGGTTPRPGEVSLAHRGVLFLDEFPEFDKRVIESLRQPLEDRVVDISRAKGSVRFPAHFIFVAAMNPCPCGFYGSSNGRCVCTASQIARYRSKISGPLIDRIDLWVPVEHVEYRELTHNDHQGESSHLLRQRVSDARDIQFARSLKRYGKEFLNNELNAKNIQEEFFDEATRNLLETSAKKMGLSPRAFHRVIKVARTIADLEGAANIEQNHILEALQYRPQQ